MHEQRANAVAQAPLPRISKRRATGGGNPAGSLLKTGDDDITPAALQLHFLSCTDATGHGGHGAKAAKNALGNGGASLSL